MNDLYPGMSSPNRLQGSPTPTLRRPRRGSDTGIQVHNLLVLVLVHVLVLVLVLVLAQLTIHLSIYIPY